MKQVTFPSTIGVFCPTCKQRALHVIVQHAAQTGLGRQRKYLMPCQHEIDPAQETEIVNAIIRSDMKNG